MRILLCEDEIELSNALVAMMRHNKYTVDAVYNGREALEYLELASYDAIVLDIMMPVLDGIEVLKTVRASGNSVPILMLTAKSQTDDIVLALDLGANDYLTKPFEIKELFARLRAVTRKVDQVPSSTIELGNTVLDRATFTLSTQGNDVSLANKEFQLLEMMMLNPSQYISTDRFMERIWGYDCDSEINVVWVHISGLRKKLSNIGSNIKIKAQRNIGYCLEITQ